MNWHASGERVLAALALLVLFLTALPIAAAQQPEAGKIEALLLETIAAAGDADLIAVFGEQADLSPAYGMGWVERGDFVYDALRETAGGAQERARAYLDGRGLAYHTFIAGNELYVWSGDLQAASALAALPEVAYVRAPRTYYVDPIVAADPPAGPDALAWGIVDTRADQFWSAFGLQGDGMVVANIDTGVQYDHPALDQAYKCPADPGNSACWSDPSDICPGDLPCDNNGHGSHTMGTMVADDDPILTWQAGMAPNALWIACKGCESSSCSDYALNACADWIVAPGGNPANRPHVVNNSWGGGAGTCDTWYLAKVNAWRAAGIFPAFSAGNEGSGCNTLGNPGVYQESFGTAAHDSSRNIASFSSRGPAPGGACDPHTPYTKPNICAPGVSICSTVPTNGWSCGYSGTSMGSPHTAGAVALLWSCNPSLVGQIDTTFQALQDTADTPPAGNCGAPPDAEGNYTFGYGYLNILQAGLVHCGAPTTPTPTLTPTPTFTPLPPVTPNAWVNLPLVFHAAVLSTPQPTATPTQTPGQTPSPGYDILVLSPDSTEGDISDLLAALNAFPDHNVAVWSNASGNPSPGDLLPYDVVIVGNDYAWEAAGLSKTVIGNSLADYIDAGGKVIESLYVQSYDQWGFGGRYLTGGYSPFTKASLDYWNPDAMQVLQPTHPVMQGVSSISDYWGHQNPGQRGGAQLLASWSGTGYNAVAVNSNVVALNLLIFHESSWTGGVPRLLHNAIVWLAGP